MKTGDQWSTCAPATVAAHARCFYAQIHFENVITERYILKIITPHWRIQQQVMSGWPIYCEWSGTFWVRFTHCGLFWVRSFSFPGSTPVCPRCVRIALTSFQGLTRVSHQCPACGVCHLGVTRGAWRHNERASVIVRLALVRGSPEWAPRGVDTGKLIERTHR